MTDLISIDQGFDCIATITRNTAERRRDAPRAAGRMLLPLPSRLRRHGPDGG